jgi:sugar O-acyltransferase (sialic acid O-acetyltransferase NeuD family)
MSSIIIFGINDTAQLAHYYLQHDSEHQVAAFCVDREYLPAEQTFFGLPVIAFDEIDQTFPHSHHQFLAPMTATNMNRDREAIYLRIKQKGYRFISYISSHATVLSNDIGENCFILEDNTIQPYTSIGDNVVLWSGNHIGHHSTVGSHAFISSHVVVSGHCDIGDYSYIGVNATLRDGLTIAAGTFIAMGATVTKDTEAWKAYLGSPARAMNKNSTDIKIYHEMD